MLQAINKVRSYGGIKPFSDYTVGIITTGSDGWVFRLNKIQYVENRLIEMCFCVGAGADEESGVLRLSQYLRPGFAPICFLGGHFIGAPNAQQRCFRKIRS
jgi:hypothetical protein